MRNLFPREQKIVLHGIRNEREHGVCEMRTVMPPGLWRYTGKTLDFWDLLQPVPLTPVLLCRSFL